MMKLSELRSLERQNPDKVREVLAGLLVKYKTPTGVARYFRCHHSAILRMLKRLNMLTPKNLNLSQREREKRSILKNKNALEYLSEQGFILVSDVEKAINTQPAEVSHDIQNGISIGVTSDHHNASRHQQSQLVKEAYEYFSYKKVDFAVNAGDLLEGNGRVYKGQMHELFLYGIRPQINYVLYTEPYPELKVGNELRKTYMISGNHDASWFSEVGIDPVQEICEKRDDLVFIGQKIGVINIKGVRIGVVHPRGSLGKDNYSAKAADLVDKWIDPKPDVIIVGHWHREGKFTHRNGFTSVVFVGSIQRTTPFIENDLMGRANCGYGILHLKKDKFGLSVIWDWQKRGH